MDSHARQAAITVRTALDVLRNYYADREGRPVAMNETQIAVYLDGLGGFSAGELEAASRQWMRTEKFFPKLSELLSLLRPAEDMAALTQKAWATVEATIRRVGAYGSVVFDDRAIGEAVRLTFGDWAHACGYDKDSAGWYGRKQQFSALFPGLYRDNATLPAVKLIGLGERDRFRPIFIPSVFGVPSQPMIAAPADQARHVLAEVERRAQQK